MEEARNAYEEGAEGYASWLSNAERICPRSRDTPTSCPHQNRMESAQDLKKALRIRQQLAE
jgi:hypothetical protein